jgi:hypothetical protein
MLLILGTILLRAFDSEGGDYLVDEDGSSSMGGRRISTVFDNNSGRFIFRGSSSGSSGRRIFRSSSSCSSSSTGGSPAGSLSCGQLTVL